MNHLNGIFAINVSANKLVAKLMLKDIVLDDETLKEIKLSKETIVEFLQKNRINFGIRYDSIDNIVNHFPNIDSPIVIAEGIDKKDGINGKITYHFDTTTDVDRTENWDFRDVMRIPTVKKGEKLATIIPPTKGKEGTTVYGTKIRPRPGKPALLRPGKNVSFKEESNSFFSNVQGQVSIINRRIHVLDVYELNESISMKTGNVDFPGSVIIRGDVPTGFTVKASGDIKIFGLVEAATIIASGSVTISEGIAGLRTGTIEAGEDVNIGYVNQGIIRAKNDILVENSIMHSECTAENNIVCNRGNIVGGILSAGGAIIANNIGNRMNTKTSLSFGMDYKLFEQQTELEQKYNELSEQREKLLMLKENYAHIDPKTIDSKTRITLLRLDYSYENVEKEMEKIEESLAKINATLGDVDRAYLKVRGTIYPNVTVSFGKYKRIIDKEYVDVVIVTDKNEIMIRN